MTKLRLVGGLMVARNKHQESPVGTGINLGLVRGPLLHIRTKVRSTWPEKPLPAKRKVVIDSARG
jgi:hypothetical protein